MTREQVREYDLPVIIKRDRRYRDDRPHEAVETEAISQRVLIDILRARLDSCCPSSSPVFLNVRHVNDAGLQRCCAGEGDEASPYRPREGTKMRDVFRAVDRVADRLVRDLDCKPARPKAWPHNANRSRERRSYVWRAPDAKPCASGPRHQ